MRFALTAEKFFILWPLMITLTNANEFKNGGFLFTAPRTFLSGNDENVCITFKNQTEDVKVTVLILEQKEDNEISSVTEEIRNNDKGNKCFKIPIPKTKIKKGRLQLTIQLKTEEDFKVNYVEQISIHTDPDITFIQTDKPVYNGGHIVRFRIFTIKPDLTPVLQTVDRIWIENPNGVHLVQWLNQSTYKGFINKTFHLSDEPLPGKWFIKMQRKNEETVTQSFMVKNYVPPKFSVSIKAPKTINSFFVNVIICAKYIFGEPVHGEVVLQYYVKCSFSFYCQENMSYVLQNLKLNADGCVDNEIYLKSPSSFVQSLIVNATVVEDGTQIKSKAFAEIEIQNIRKKTVPEFSIDTKSKKFRPGLPFKGKVVFKSNPENYESVSVCFYANEMRYCKDLLIREGEADFLILPIPIKNERNFKAFLEVKSVKNNTQINGSSKLSLIPWYSPTGSYIQLEDNSARLLQCGQKARINVLYSSDTTAIRFYYMIKARGDIIKTGTLDGFSSYSRPFDIKKGENIINNGDVRRVRQFQFYVDLSPIMAPNSQVLVYFIRDDGEIIADSLQLTVEKCLPNPVKTKWSKKVSLPGQKNNFLIETSSNSICALTVRDKSTELVSKSNRIKSNEVFKELEKFQTKTPLSEYGANRCKDNSGENSQFFQEGLQISLGPQEPDSPFIDSLYAFNDMGALVITDLNLETRPCREKKSEEKMLNATTRNSNVKVYGNEIENISIFKARNSSKDVNSIFRDSFLENEIRSFFPETWIWEIIDLNETGNTNLIFEAPHTLTQWEAETICLSPTRGLGIAENSKFVTYQPFFLDFAVPHSLKKKEIFHLQVSVFNYEFIDLPVKITLSPMEHFISRSDESRSYCIKTKSKIVHRFILESVKLGEAQIIVKAEIDSGFEGDCGNAVSGKSDIVMKKTVILHEGYPVEEIKSGFICGESLHFDRQVSWNMRIPPEVVEKSIAVKAFVSGDILGPSLENIDHLITLPTGCGEQNMILLVPNVLLLDYLLLTKSEELDPIERALKNLDLGYQRQLNYRHNDGSYSAFGEQDEKGSIWLTAFVIRYLSQARKYIYVDENDLNESIAWIIKQQMENGCFPMIGKIYHRKLQEKILEEDSSKTLTAYILISLIEAGISLENPIVKNAIYCLKPTEESLGIYGDMLSSYALILAGEYRDSQGLMMELLKDSKRSYGMLWWENDDSIESAIEMTGYGILTLIKLGGPLFLAAASDAVRWIVQFQNQNGGFMSSQDTVLALEAISKFSATLPRMNDLDILSVRVQTLENNHIFNISNSNRLIQQSINLPSFVTDVYFESSGKGCALVQTWLKYNIRKAKPSDNFKIQLKIHSVSNVDRYSVVKFHICVRFKSPKDKVNMAVLEVPMVSGYYPDRSSLYEIKTSRKGVRRWEEYEDKVNFYFEDLRNRKICVDFLVVQEICIENAAPALIRLYDYYNIKHHSILKYNLMRNCEDGSWLDMPSYEIKQESKRDLKFSKGPEPLYEDNSFIEDNFPGFVDLDQDLETPKSGGDRLPVFALPPPSESQGHNCAHCLENPPQIFPKLYCSSQVAVKVHILSKDTFEFLLDVSPRSNFTALKRTVSYTVKSECECPILKLVDTYALLLVTPPRSFKVQSIQELHIDDSVQLYPWSNSYEIPKFLNEAINYCQKWPLNYDT